MDEDVVMAQFKFSGITCRRICMEMYVACCDN
jgi:hypothetical protein